GSTPPWPASTTISRLRARFGEPSCGAAAASKAVAVAGSGRSVEPRSAAGSAGVAAEICSARRMMDVTRSPPPRSASHLALVLALLLIEALVVQLLPLRQRQRHLRPPSGEMHVQRHQREPLPLDSTDQLPNLARM